MIATVGVILTVGALGGATCGLATAFLAGRAFRASLPDRPMAPPVTVLRPLSGAHAGLAEALGSTVLQDYVGEIQLACGTADAADPAIAVVEQLKEGHPQRDISLVIGAKAEGANRKISNLSNMMSAAKHDVLVLADSDIVAPSGWLTSVIGALSSPHVGGVSCFYAGIGADRWSRLAAMGISYQFLPNAIFGAETGLAHPCFGSTIAMRRETLVEVGGFSAFRNTLADDYEMGRTVRAKGYCLAYPPLLVRHICAEKSFMELWRHELRWARTIRTVDPLGHFGSVVTHPLPFGILGALLTGLSPASLAVLATVLLVRLFLKSRIDHIAGARSGPAWLLPARDMLSFGIFLASLFGRRVEWQGARLKIGEHGTIS